LGKNRNMRTTARLEGPETGRRDRQGKGRKEMTKSLKAPFALSRCPKKLKRKGKPKKSPK